VPLQLVAHPRKVLFFAGPEARCGGAIFPLPRASNLLIRSFLLRASHFSCFFMFTFRFVFLWGQDGSLQTARLTFLLFGLLASNCVRRVFLDEILSFFSFFFDLIFLWPFRHSFLLPIAALSVSPLLVDFFRSAGIFTPHGDAGLPELLGP